MRFHDRLWGDAVYRFGDFTLGPDYGLSRNGKIVPLEPLALELLQYLVDNRSRIVSRDELNEQLWDGRAVSDAALSTQVRSVRRALGDDRVQQRYVRTHPRRGFSFVAPVRIVDAADAEAEGHGQAGTRPPRFSGRWPWAAAALMLLLVVTAASVWIERAAAPVATPAEHALSIVVLPFDNLSGDGGQDYLADAFTEDLVIDLSRIRDAFVISRSTSFTYRDRQVDAASVAHELGVRYVLGGSLRADGDHVRINAQLIDGKTSRELWADRYDRTLANLFSVQENVTGRIASVLRAELRLADDRRQLPEATRDAWDYALRGNVILYNHQSITDYQNAHALLTKAVALDPTISSAWGGLAFVHFVASSGNVPGISQPDSAQRSLDAALKAVEADPMNAEPYWLVGAGYARNGQPDRGMAACQTAMELNPNMDCGHVCAGLVHLAKGEPDKAIPYFQFALKLNPRFRPFTKEKYLGLAYLQTGQDVLAIAALNRALSKAPKDNFANLALTSALALNGQSAAARRTLDTFIELTGNEPPTLASLRNAIGWMGPQVERMLQGLRAAGVAEG